MHATSRTTSRAASGRVARAPTRSRGSGRRWSSGSKATSGTSSDCRPRSSSACWPSASREPTALADVVRGEDGNRRCRWGAGDEAYRRYHDTEWGRPALEERGLYEKLCLECLQSGLSWALILRKRDGIRDAFAGFEPEVVAGFGVREAN